MMIPTARSFLFLPFSHKSKNFAHISEEKELPEFSVIVTPTIIIFYPFPSSNIYYIIISYVTTCSINIILYIHIYHHACSLYVLQKYIICKVCLDIIIDIFESRFN